MKQILGYFLGFAIFIAGIPALVWLVAGMPTIADIPVVRLYLGILLALAGLALSVWSIVYMQRVGKGNPMLTGTFIYYIGILLVLWSVWALLVFAAVAGLMMFQVRSEEKRLEGDFGGEYLEYKKRVRRFL